MTVTYWLARTVRGDVYSIRGNTLEDVGGKLTERGYKETYLGTTRCFLHDDGDVYSYPIQFSIPYSNIMSLTDNAVIIAEEVRVLGPYSRPLTN